MPTLDAIIAAAFLWGLGITFVFTWLLIIEYIFDQWGWFIPAILVVVTLIFLTAAILS